ncbi:MAG: acyl carrier protein [Chloroflexota bacterium]|nr:acyl carrier protein [Chloroflexota bacterium]
MQEETFVKVKDIVADILSIDADTLALEARFREDLGADSLDLVELIMGFEDEFGGHISDEDARDIVTIEDAVKYLASNT